MAEEEEIFVSYGFREFLTDFGGLLGLFLGCSMLSLAELVFYPMLTLIRLWKMRKARKIQAEKENSLAVFVVERWKNFYDRKLKEKQEEDSKEIEENGEVENESTLVVEAEAQSSDKFHQSQAKQIKTEIPGLVFENEKKGDEILKIIDEIDEILNENYENEDFR